MEISLIADTLTTAAATQGLGLGFTNFQFTSNNHLSFNDSSPEQQPSAGVRQISALIFPIDAVAPPPVKFNNVKTIPRRMVRKSRRTRRRSLTDGGGCDDGENSVGFYGDAGFGGGGPFGGGGGRRWDFGGFGGWNWDESSSASWSDPAFDFVYEVICWIALSNCLHFAFKRVVRIVADPAREKVPMRLAPFCLSGTVSSF